MIGVDEKSIGKGRDYITLVNDGDCAAENYIGNDRKQESLHARFSEKKRASIKNITLSICATHPASLQIHVPSFE
jgi:transposase